MLARVTAPRSYQALHDTPFLKRGGHSVGVAKQYATTQKQGVNYQVAVTAALWTGVRGWLVGANVGRVPLRI